MDTILHIRCILVLLLPLTLISGCDHVPEPLQTIDRFALVSRHNVVLTETDTLGALSVGNGNFTFTVDISGLQSFPEAYVHGINLGTQSQWGWHSIPDTAGYTREDVLVDYETCNDKKIPIATQHSSGRASGAAHWLRANPHRLHLGLISLELIREDGSPAQLQDLDDPRQELDLWTGGITSTYTLDDVPVKVETFGHFELDQVAFRISSTLLDAGRIRVKIAFPYGKECHVCPGYDWQHPERHNSTITQSSASQVWIRRQVDSTRYFVGITTNDGTLTQSSAHHFSIQPETADATFTCALMFAQDTDVEVKEFNATRTSSTDGWQKFWTEGAAIDFSGSTDPRAAELERRVILSQYLTRIQCAGMYPPQETGLTFNSWYGKFHLEMHWWHGVHFALWNRLPLLERSLGWYDEIIRQATSAAQEQGFAGARWPKMTGPAGVSSPSSVGEFLVWQQPHPIYFAELVYRQHPGQETLERFRDIVFKTADFMASFAQFDTVGGKYHLCHPLIPAQEIFPATETDDPPFELAYWHFGLNVAQQWRVRLGLEPDPGWQQVLDHLAPLPRSDSLYLPAARAFHAYSDDANRRDHPIVTGVYGMLPGYAGIDTTVMEKTFQEITKRWDWQSTWGWDYPMLAMCAARLGHRDAAVDALMMDTQKNTYLVNGHNYQDQRLRIYLPGNGGLLTAVAMMAGGWDGAPSSDQPGFPSDGSWQVRSEGLRAMP